MDLKTRDQESYQNKSLNLSEPPFFSSKMKLVNSFLQNLPKTAYVEHLAHSSEWFFLLERNRIMKDFEWVLIKIIILLSAHNVPSSVLIICHSVNLREIKSEFPKVTELDSGFWTPETVLAQCGDKALGWILTLNPWVESFQCQHFPVWLCLVMIISFSQFFFLVKIELIHHRGESV